MPGCRGYASDHPPTDFNLELSFKMGLCAGAIRSFVHLEVICPPPKVIDQQAARVIVQYIDARPARMHEKFIGLALEAMQAAWPCKR
jgi:Rap1a immunity proteins